MMSKSFVLPVLQLHHTKIHNLECFVMFSPSPLYFQFVISLVPPQNMNYLFHICWGKQNMHILQLGQFQVLVHLFKKYSPSGFQSTQGIIKNYLLIITTVIIYFHTIWCQRVCWVSNKIIWDFESSLIGKILVCSINTTETLRHSTFCLKSPNFCLISFLFWGKCRDLGLKYDDIEWQT